MDHSINEGPVVKENFLEVGCSAEVYAKGAGETPFGPVNITFPASTNSSKMLQVLVTDFVPNSMMYQSHKYNLIIKVKKRSKY